MKPRPVILALIAALVAALAAGCGGGGGEGADPATLAPPKTPLYVRVTIRPEGETKANVDALAQKIGGIENLGDFVVEKLEESAAEEGEKIDFEKEVEPWLGREGAVFSPEYEEGGFKETVEAVQVTDSGAAEEFLDRHAKSPQGPAKDGSYEGVDFKVERDDGQTLGVLGGLLVVADDEALFKQVVEASNGESLADESTFTDAMSQASGGSAADVYLDLGALIRSSGSELSPSTKLIFENAGIDVNDATLVASLVPHSDQIEIDSSTNATPKNPPSGDGSQMLGSLPRESVLAFASPEFGKRLSEEIDLLDEHGIPGQVPPHQLKKGLKQAGIDLEGIASSINDLGIFVEGNGKRNIGGAAVFTTASAQQAKNTVSNIGLFLRTSGTPGVTAIGQNLTGFSIHSSELGSKPVVVAAKGDRIAIAYGLPAAVAGLSGSGENLSDSPTYQEAARALGGTPISGFVDGPAALELVSSLVGPGDEGFSRAKRYLSKIDYVAIGAEESGDRATAKLIVGIGG